MQNKKKKLLAAFASVSMLTGSAYAIPPDNQKIVQPTETANNNQKCEIPTKLQGGGGRVYRERSCVSLKDFFNNPASYKNETSYQSIMALYNSSELGKEMLTQAANDGLRLCDMELSSRVAAVYQAGLKRVGVDYSRNYPLAEYVSSVTHELTHHYQDLNGADYFRLDRTLKQNQRAMLAMETAAPTAEIIALFLADQSGAIDWRKDVEENTWNYVYLQYFDYAYNKMITEEKLTHDQAINVAANFVWQIILQNQFRLDFYNDSAARFTLLYADHLQPEMKGAQESVDQAILGSGKIGEDINFTHPKYMPEDDKLFGKNDDMRRVFEAVEWYRQSKLLGENHATVVAKKQQLIAAGNKFVTADFDAVICKIRQGSSTLDAFKSVVSPAAASADDMKRQPANNSTLSIRYTPMEL